MPFGGKDISSSAEQKHRFDSPIGGDRIRRIGGKRVDNSRLPEISNARLIARLVLGAIAIMGFLFGSAGTVKWLEAWIFIVGYFVWATPLMFWLKRNSPRLLRERMDWANMPVRAWDKAIVVAGGIIWIIFFLVPGFDAVRFEWSRVPAGLKVLGFIGLIPTFRLISRVMRVNAFASKVVKVQKDHTVVTVGPYSHVRHPMYTGIIIMSVSIPMALGSYYALIPGALSVGLIIVRTILEDRALQRELAGYQEYSVNVRYRLVPGIW